MCFSFLSFILVLCYCIAFYIFLTKVNCEIIISIEPIINHICFPHIQFKFISDLLIFDSYLISDFDGYGYHFFISNNIRICICIWKLEADMVNIISDPYPIRLHPYTWSKCGSLRFFLFYLHQFSDFSSFFGTMIVILSWIRTSA